jgi:hypothetical protein
VTLKRAILGLVTVLCACATQQSVIPKPVAPAGIVVVRDFVDPVKTANGDVYMKIQYAWDYDRGVAIVRKRSMDDTLIDEQLEPGLTLETTEPELAYAFDLIRSDATLGPIAARKDARLYGGFSLRVPNTQAANGIAADLVCRAKSRCIHIMISGGNNGETSLAHAIVDLASRRIVDPNYRGDTPPNQPNTGK